MSDGSRPLVLTCRCMADIAVRAAGDTLGQSIRGAMRMLLLV
jgi:hypothetical protein